MIEDLIYFREYIRTYHILPEPSPFLHVSHFLASYLLSLLSQMCCTLTMYIVSREGNNQLRLADNTVRLVNELLLGRGPGGK